MLGAPPVNWARLSLVAAILVLAIFFQKAQANSMGWSFDLGLTLLISSSLLLNFLDLIFLEIIATAMFMWKPAFSPELLVLLLLPLGAFWGRKILSISPWTQNLAFISIALIVFYVVQGPRALFENWPIMLNNLIGCLVFGSALFFFFENLYESRLD